MQKADFLETFQQMLVASFEMHASSEVLDANGVADAAGRLHNLGGKLSPQAMEVIVGVLITQWAVYVAQDDHFMHPEEAIDYMIAKLDRILT